VVRDATTGEEIQRFSNGAGCILSVAFSPDGKQIAVSSPVRETKIWDFETDRELINLPGASSVQFTPDGTRLIIGRQQGTVLAHESVGIYLMRLEDLVALAKSRLTRSLTLDECKQYLHMEHCPLEP
jgi:WD40 repeat protein